MIRLLLALYLIASLCRPYRSWGELSWEEEWRVLQTVTPGPSATPTPWRDCAANAFFRGLCRDRP